MAKEPELMISAYSFTSDVPYPIEIKRGLTLLANDPIVISHPKAFVPQSAGELALVGRARQMENAMDQLREKQRQDRRQSAIAAGTRILPSDDAVAESAKKQVKADDRLELVYDANGTVTGARKKS